MDGITPDERARATGLVHKLMLQTLWSEFLARFDEPQEEAAAIEQATLTQLESILSHVRGRDAEITQHVAVTALEDMWRTIRATLADSAEPIGVRLPTRGEAQAAPNADGEPEAPE